MRETQTTEAVAMLDQQKATKVYGRDWITGNETQVTVDCGVHAYTLRRGMDGMWFHVMLPRPLRHLRDAVEAIRSADRRMG